MKCYLAGTINTNDDYFQRWRKEASIYLKNHGIMPLSPLVSKELSSSKDGGITSHVPNTAIMARDYAMVRSAHLILANLKIVGDNGPCDKPFIGTFYELAWAWEQKTPVVAVIEPDNYLFNEHPFLRDTSVTQKFATLEEALENVVEYWNWGWERPSLMS